MISGSGVTEIKTGWKRALIPPMDAGSPWDPGPEGKACDNDLEAAHLADFTNEVPLWK